MKPLKLIKSYFEVEKTYLAKMDKLNIKKLAFETKQEKERINFLMKYEKEKLKIEQEFEKEIANCRDIPKTLPIQVVQDPDNLGDYE